MRTKAIGILIAGIAMAAVPFSAIARFVKIYHVPETGRTIFLDDEKVYSITTSIGRHGCLCYDTREDSFIDSRSKQKFVLREDEWIKDISSIDGIKPGGGMVGYITWKIQKGTTVFGYPFDHKDIDHNVSSNLLSTAVDGDRIKYQSAGTNYCFVAVYSTQDNSLQWHEPESFEVCHSFPIPDADTPFYYARMQDVNTDVIFSGGRMLKSGDVIYFRDHGIDETYRIVDQYGFEKEFDRSANLLGGISVLKSVTPKLSILNPKKFYVILKSGHRAFGMFQPSIDVNKTVFSPITSAPLSVSKSDIARFETIGDGAFPQSECYTKNEVDSLYKRYMIELEEQPKDGFITRTLHQLTGEFWDREHPVRSISWMCLFLGGIWLCKCMYKVWRRIWEWLLRRKHR